MLYRLALIVVTLFMLHACASDQPDFSRIPAVEMDFNCENTKLLAIPDDPRARGPWPVGAKTVTLKSHFGKRLTTEIWYPAVPGSNAGKTKHTYDLRYTLPAADAAKIPDQSPLVQDCDCYRDLPIDALHGQYPVIMYIHGTASFRTASLSQVTHWASRGFVVINIDNPFIQLRDAKKSPLTIRLANQGQDTVTVIENLHHLPDTMAFLKNAIDLKRLGIAGHSAGGRAAAQFGDAPGVRTIIPMASGGVTAGQYLRSTMILAANNDGIVEYNASIDGYNDSPSPKRFAGMDSGGHLAFTELCAIGQEFGGIVPLVKSYGIDVPDAFLRLGTDGCGIGNTVPEAGWEWINYLSTAAFEETLQCSTTATDWLNAAQSELPLLRDYQQSL